MGQRFQIYVNTKQTKFKEGKETFKTKRVNLHMQWCWGHFSIIRAKQLLNFFKEDLESEVPTCRRDWKRAVDYRKNSERSQEQFETIVQALSSINMDYNSFSDAVFEDLNNPFEGDNNDGFLVVDLVEDKPRFSFGCFKYIEQEDEGEDNYKIKIMTAEEYMTLYNEDRDFDNYIEEARKLDDSFEHLNKEDFIRIFKGLKENDFIN